MRWIACTAALLSLGMTLRRAHAAELIEALSAVVNGEAIWLSEVRQRMEPFSDALAAEAPSQQAEARGRLYSQVLKEAIDRILVRQAAAKANISITPPEIDRAIANIRGQSGLDEQAFTQLIRQQGLDEAAYRADVRDQLLRLKLLNQKVRARIQIDDNEVRAKYEQQKASQSQAMRFRVAHLFFAVGEELAPGPAETVRREAIEARDYITRAGFDDALGRYAGGELGWVRQQDLPAALENALANLAVGGVSNPVRGPNGWHILKLRGRQRSEDRFPPFDEKAGEIRNALLEEAMRAQEQSYMSQLRRAALIDRPLSQR